MAYFVSLTLSFVFLFVSLMFFINIMPQMFIMQEVLQAEELNIIDAMTIIEGTVQLLRNVQ